MFAAKCREFGTVSNSSCESDATRHTSAAVRFPSHHLRTTAATFVGKFDRVYRTQRFDGSLRAAKCPRTGSPWTASPISRNLRRCSRPKFPRHPVSLVFPIYTYNVCLYVYMYMYMCIHVYVYARIHRWIFVFVSASSNIDPFTRRVSVARIRQ